MKIKNQSGRSMLEMLGVLAIVGILSVAGIAGYSKAMQKQRINNIRNQITHIVAGIKQYYLRQNSYNGLTTDVAIQAGIIPEDMVIEDAGGDTVSVKNVYGGDIWVEAKTDTDDNQTMFMVILTGLPKEDAIDIGSADWKSDSDLVEINITSESENAGD